MNVDVDAAAKEGTNGKPEDRTAHTTHTGYSHTAVERILVPKFQTRFPLLLSSISLTAQEIL